MRKLAIVAALLCSTATNAQPPADLAAAFAARPQVEDASMSPDGKEVALVMPGQGRASGVVVVDIATGTMKPVYAANGTDDDINSCDWVGDHRLACQVSGITAGATRPLPFSGVVAFDDTGANPKLLSRRQRLGELWTDTRGGGIVDLLPDEQNAVLMVRAYAPQMQTGSIIKMDQEGLAVERIDTRNGTARTVLQPDRTASTFVTDGHGQVRVRGHDLLNDDGYSKGRTAYQYKPTGSSGWKPLSVYDYSTRSGFTPYAVDRAKDVVYGSEPVDGRQALVAYKLDGSMNRTVLFKHDSVDVGGPIQIGRSQRVVGVSYSTDRNHAEYFDPDIRALQEKLGAALGGDREVAIVDMSADERKALVFAGSDTDPGRYYVLDRDTNKLALLTQTNPELGEVQLSPVKSISYRAADGTIIPAYLTLPKGSTGKNLPAIVMPHGGPEARDTWGYDYLPQYFAARGFAVIQPQFRGSAGFGSAWFQKNGFKGWRTSIGDVVDAGHYLISAGIADPAKLGIFGWSYGGYAALQSNVLEPNLFKAVVAVAPVTDLGDLKADARDSSDFLVTEAFIGSGANAKEGSPAQNASRFVAPVLMFQGTYDLNVPVAQSKLMDARLRSAGKTSELVIFDKLDHQLYDPVARRTLLQRSGEFLARAGK